jgi:hypothetical protein
MRNSLMAGATASAFAHLLGWARPAGARAEEEDDNQEDAARAEDDDDQDQDDDDKAKKSKKAKGAKAEGEDDDADVSAEDDDDQDQDDDDKAKKSKKAKGAKAEEDDDNQDDDDKAKGAKAERARWAKVLKSPAAGHGRIAAACEMLSNTDMSSQAVIATLGALPAGGAASGLRDRMAGVSRPDVGGSGSQAPGNKSAALAAQIVEAGKIRRGEK